jgi:DNA-binding transcriptional ArsR family regulator
MISVLASVAPAINAVATVILVIVTAAYVFLTWGMVKETRQARKQEVKPVMNLDVEPFSIGAWAPKIENVGNDPALDVSGTVRLEPGGESYEVKSKNIPAGDFTGSMNPQVSEDTHEEYDSLTIEGEYMDVFGVKDTFEETYDLELLAELDGADSMMKRDQEARHLRSIDKRLQSIAQSIEMDGVQKVLKMESRGRVLTQLREHGPLTVQGLSEKTGLTHFELGEDLMWLSEAGAVEYDVEQEEIINEENQDVEIRVRDMESDSVE